MASLLPRRLQPYHVTGDARYDTIENIVALKAVSIRAYVPLPDFDHRPAFYGQEAFAYNPKRNEYRCRKDHVLIREWVKVTEGVIVYWADARTCNACPVKTQCTASDCGRVVHRSLDVN